MSIAAVTNNSPIFEVPKPIKKTASLHEKAGMLVEAGNSFVDTIEQLSGKVSSAVKQTFGILAFVGGLGLVFAIPNMISNITKAVWGSSLVERIKSAGRAVLDSAAIWASTNAILTGLRSVNVLSAEALGWTYIVNIIFFPIQLIDVGIDCHELGELKAQRESILSRISVKDVAKSLEYIKENQQEMRKILGISKKAKLIDEQSGAEEIVTLRRRISIKYNLKVTNLVIKVATLVMTGVTLFMPINPVSMGIAGLCGLAGVITFGVEKLMLPKDPFAVSDVWYSKVANTVRGVFNYLTDAIDRSCNAPNMAASIA